MAVQQRAPAQALEREAHRANRPRWGARAGVCRPADGRRDRAGWFRRHRPRHQRARVDAVNAGASPVSDVEDATLRELLDAERLRASTDLDLLAELRRRPDRRADAAQGRPPARLPLRPGSHPRHRRAPASGHAGDPPEHLLAGHHPRGDAADAGSRPGWRSARTTSWSSRPSGSTRATPRFNVRNTPKLIGGITPTCTELAAAAVPAPSWTSWCRSARPEVAETSKLVENTFRFINISFVNEIALLCDRIGISVWEVIEAATTKPFAFMPHYPGAGVGGHCIPIVPFYLEAIAQKHGVMAAMIEAAGRINDHMPTFVIEKMARLLRERGQERPAGAGARARASPTSATWPTCASPRR